MKQNKQGKQTYVRLTDANIKLLDKAYDKFKINKTSLINFALDDFFKKHKIFIE